MRAGGGLPARCEIRPQSDRERADRVPGGRSTVGAAGDGGKTGGGRGRTGVGLAFDRWAVAQRYAPPPIARAAYGLSQAWCHAWGSQRGCQALPACATEASVGPFPRRPPRGAAPSRARSGPRLSPQIMVRAAGSRTDVGRLRILEGPSGVERSQCRRALPRPPLPGSLSNPRPASLSSLPARVPGCRPVRSLTAFRALPSPDRRSSRILWPRSAPEDPLHGPTRPGLVVASPAALGGAEAGRTSPRLPLSPDPPPSWPDPRGPPSTGPRSKRL